MQCFRVPFLSLSLPNIKNNYSNYEILIFFFSLGECYLSKVYLFFIFLFIYFCLCLAFILEEK